jgi:hypothetical protein
MSGGCVSVASRGVRRLDVPEVSLDADRAAAEVVGGDGRCAAAAERVEHHTSQRAHHADQLLEEGTGFSV